MNRVFWLIFPLLTAATGFGQYTITTSGLPVASVNQAYATNVQTNSFVPASACTIVSGSLPPGMNIQTNGPGCLISGNPAAAITANFTLTVSNNQGQTTPAQALVLPVFGITTTAVPSGVLNSTYGFQLLANGGGQYQWSVVSGSLPTGLVLSLGGYLSGTIRSSGVFSFGVQLTDAVQGLTDTRVFSLAVGGPGGQFQIISSTLPDATANQAYSATIQTNGAQGNLNSCTVIQGSLPPGISLAASGTSCLFSGTPSNQGTYQFQVRASDSQGQITPALLFTINVAPGGGSGSGGLNINTVVVPNGTTAFAYLPNGVPFAFTAVGGTGIYSWFLDSGNLPPGLSLGTNGSLTGTPTQAGSYSFTIRVVSSGLLTSFQQTATKTFAMTINSGGLAIVETSLPVASIGQLYTFALHASGGTAPYRWRFGGPAVDGFTIDFNSGVISGTSQSAGSFTLPVTVSDAAGAQTTFVFPFVVSTPFSILNSSLADGLAGAGYSQTLQASGGQAPYTWSVSSGLLPPGLTLTSSGNLSGVPTVNGQYTFTVLATDATGRQATKVLSVLIGAPGLVQILTNSLANGAVGTTYSQVVAASGGQLPYTWSVNSGTLPPGLVIGTQTGTIQGTPTQGGTFYFSIQAADAIGNVASRPLTIVIGSSGFSAVPNQLSFSYFAGGAQPAAQQVTVSGSTNVAFTASTNTSWLSVNPLSGTSPAQLTISANPFGLAVGVYSGSITVTPSGVSDPPQVISVSLTVSTNSALTVSSSTLAFTYLTNGGIPAPQNLIVGSSGGSIFFSTAVSGATWLTVSPASGNTPATLTVSVNPLGLSAGTYNGTVTIFGAGVFRQVAVTLTVVTPAPPTVTLSKNSVAFTYQPGGALPPTQFVALASSSPISFSASSGFPWLVVSPDVGTTPANLLLSVNPAGLAPGVYNGAIVVTTTGIAGNNTLTLPISLTIGTSAGFPVINAIVNAASFGGGPISPGEIVAVAGSSLGPVTSASLTLDQSGKVATTLGGVQVLFNGFPAPLIYVSSSQINAVVPYEIAGQLSLLVAVRYQGQTSNAFPVTLSATAPGLFSLNSSGSGPGAILNQDSSSNSPQRPARRGDIVVLYMTGEGQTGPPGSTGKVTTVAPGLPLTPQPLLPVTVFIGGQPSQVTFFGEAPGVVAGVLQINVQVPLSAASGDLPVEVAIGGNRTQRGVTVSVQ